MKDGLITYDRALDATRAVVAGNEDHVYEQVPHVVVVDGRPLASTRCAYVSNGKPSCIVGHVLRTLGVPMEVITGLDGLADAGIDGDGVAYLRMCGLDVDPDAQGFLGILQGHQDGGAPWGQCLDDALNGPS